MATLPLSLGALWLLARARSFQLLGEVVARVETEERVVALTFDDGPTPEHTEEVLRLLAAHEVRATFFLIGRELERSPELGRRLVEAGHALGNHTYAHARLTGASPAQVREELARTDALPREAGQVGDIPFRAPYGKRLLAASWVLWREGRTHITWDVEPESEAELAQDSARLAAHVLEQVRPGSIVLLHPMYASREPTRQALPAILRGLQARGYRFVTVPELLALRRRDA